MQRMQDCNLLEGGKMGGQREDWKTGQKNGKIARQDRRMGDWKTGQKNGMTKAGQKNGITDRHRNKITRRLEDKTDHYEEGKMAGHRGKATRMKDHRLIAFNPDVSNESPADVLHVHLAMPPSGTVTRLRQLPPHTQ